MPSERELVLLTGSANEPLANEIGKFLQTPVYNPTTIFANGETRPITPFVRDREVYIIQPTAPNVDRSYMELFLIADAVKRAHAGKIIAVTPYFGYGRQDRKDQAHTAISAKLMAKLIECSGVNHIVTMDMHSDQSEGFFEIDYDNLQGSYCLIPRIKDLGIPNLKVASPDLGGAPRARAYNSRLPGEGIVIGYKERDYKSRNKSSTPFLIGEVANFNILIVDDQIDTAGSITDLALLLKEAGACSVIVAATHGVLSEPAVERITTSPIDRVFITNSILQSQINSKIEVLSIASLLAEAIKRIHCGKSIGEVLID